MATTAQCPQCSAWNPSQATRCKACGAELRGAQISFEGPPPEARRVRSPEEEKALGERRARGHADAMRATRKHKKDEEAKRKAYLERKAILANAIAERKVRPREPPAGGTHAAGEDARGPENALDRPDRAAEVDSTNPVDPTAVARRPEAARIPTHVRGLDESIGGGVPRGYVVVLEGAPGTMKSSLAFWILAHNAREGGRGAYLACEESVASLFRQMDSLGVDRTGLGERIRIFDSASLREILKASRGDDWLSPLQSAVAKEKGLDVLVLDSLDALEVLTGFEDRRREIFRLFEWLRDTGITTFVIAERPDYVVGGHILQGRHEENFLADGVLNLRMHLVTDQDVQRRLRVVKLRGTRHETAYLALHVAPGELEVSRVLGG